MLSKTKALIAKHKKKAAIGLVVTVVAGIGVTGATTALLGGREDIEENIVAVGQYDVASGPSSSRMNAALYPGATSSQTIEVTNSGDFNAAYGIEVKTEDGATVDPSIYADIDVTLAGAINWNGSFAELEALTVVDSTGIQPKGQNATSEVTTLTLSVPTDETNPGFGQAGEFSYTLSILHNQNNGSGNPELLTGLTGTGETKVKPKA